MPGIIHLIAPAGALRPFYEALDVSNSTGLLNVFQQMLGDSFTVRAEGSILDAGEDEHAGGRTDDGARAADITRALADPAVAAILCVRGGAWFTRILPRIDFSVLDRRESPVSMFGFSELTPLINVVAMHRMGRGFYDMGPAFLTYGLRRHAAQSLHLTESTNPTAHQWMRGSLRAHLAAYLRNRSALLGTHGGLSIRAQHVRGALPQTSAQFVGGNLTVLSTLLGTPYEACIAPEGRWLVLEDFNDKLERFDRFLAHFTLARFWQRCSGLLLGDFHRGSMDLRPAVLAMLDYHLHGRPNLPVFRSDDVGHVWPMKPLPLHRPATVIHHGEENFEFQFDGS